MASIMKGSVFDSDVPINRYWESVCLKEGISIGFVKNIRNIRFNTDYFTVALIMKFIVISIQLNSN